MVTIGTGTAVTIDEAIRRGAACARGAAGRPDLVAAHRWFNTAALKGSEAGAALRRDVAATMTKSEIAHALRAARTGMAA